MSHHLAIVRLKEPNAREGPPRLRKRAASQRIAMKEQLAELIPGLDVIRIRVNQLAIAMSRLLDVPLTPIEMRFDENAIVLGETVSEADGEAGGGEHELLTTRPIRRVAQPIVSERKRRILADRPLV